MDFDLSEWLNIVVRWAHVFAGILWIGQTYFFTWLDGRFDELKRKQGSGKADPVWMVHSGGFYIVTKQKVPEIMPATLHWFRWEAAITWLTGMSLLILVYYYGGLMVGGTIDETAALWIGVVSLLAGWPIYEAIWRSPLGRDELLGGAVSFLFIVGASYGFTQWMGGRAAYIHVGAIFGTIMAANVWFTIVPAQRKMVGTLYAGKEPDLALVQKAKQCSKHNTYLVVPLVFIMISNHFPTASYGTTMNWLVLSTIVLVGWGAAKIVRRA